MTICLICCAVMALVQPRSGCLGLVSITVRSNEKMSLERNRKFKLKKARSGIPAGTEGFITREPANDLDSYGVRICGVDMDLLPQFVEVVSDTAG